jgi:hypothetical protein
MLEMHTCVDVRPVSRDPKGFFFKKHLGFLITAPAIGFAARTRTPRRVTVAGSHGHGLPLSLEICGLVYGVRT